MTGPTERGPVPDPSRVLTDPRPEPVGLTREEAAARLERWGPNTLPSPARRGPLRALASQLDNPLVRVLVLAALLTAGLGAYVDSLVIAAVVVVNAVVGFLQETRAESALDALRSLVHTRATVVRSGREEVVDAEELVPGDLVLLRAGDAVPADLGLVHVEELLVDESNLTGESVPVPKQSEALPEDTPLADRADLAHAGTLVVHGSAAGTVVATGTRTELGAIHRLVATAHPLATPLTRKLDAFSRQLTVAILGLAALTVGVGLLRGQALSSSVTAAVALAVGAIPEGLPAAVTITLAIGVTRMARRRAVVRRLPVVETLGSTTVICTDKTGTLTENRMRVRTVWTDSGAHPLADAADAAGALAADDRALRWSLVCGALCHEGTSAAPTDPTEAAMVAAATTAGLAVDGLAARYPRVATIPFGHARGFMATLHRDVEATDPATGVVLVKGAVEQVLARSSGHLRADGTIAPLDVRRVEAAVAELADQGLRVLATAVVPTVVVDPEHPHLDEDRLPRPLVLTGLQAMQDPPREAAARAVSACLAAGIAVKMITGDHASTAAAIARQVGLLGGTERGAPDVLTGAELAALPPDRLPEAVERARVFARVSPGQKLQLVQALQERGHVVAMTGDGVNDAPALRRADIGVAMGGIGTAVAEDAADMVLTDDDFATIEAAVEEGRGVFDNLTKFIAWTLPTNLAEGLVIVVAIALGTALPILPTQILWINMTTAVALGLMLAFEPKEAGLMTRRPRDPAQPLLTRSLMVRIALVCLLLVAGSWWLFEWERSRGASLDQARTAALNLFVAVQAVYLISCRSLTGSVRRVGVWSNPWVVLGIAVQCAGQALLTYEPHLGAVFHTAPLGGAAWLRIALIALLAGVVVSVEKRSRRMMQEERSP